MKHNETKFVVLVHKMRKAQNEFFATRSEAALREAKRLEKKVDEMIDEVLNPNLF